MPPDEFKQLQIGAIRTDMYHIKSTQGKETLKTVVKLTDVKKIPSQKPKISQNKFLTLLER